MYEYVRADGTVTDEPTADLRRKYRMTKMPDGDWMFVANDGVTLCRVGWYMEDGSAENGRGGWITGKFWDTFIFKGTLTEAGATVEVDEEGFADRHAFRYWDAVATMQRTRQEAIDYALEVVERRGVAAMREP